LVKKINQANDLFNFDIHQFPKTRYQGSKYKLREWIKDSLEKIDFETALDAFSGTASISYTMKEMGKKIYSNDILQFNFEISRALIENQEEQITKEEFEKVIRREQGVNYSYFIKDTFKDIYFLDDENEWLDITVQNILKIENKYKKSMLLWALYQSALSKRPYNLFHRKNLYIRNANVKRNFGNKTTWDKPFEEHFYKFIKEINNAVFNNKKENRVFCSDVFDLNISVDLIYIDTPYIPKKGTLTHYRDFYHFLEGLSNYHNWEQYVDYSSKHRKFLPRYNIWEDKKNIHLGFKKLIEKFKNSIIVISYRDDGIPSISEIIKILEYFGKQVSIERINYQYVLSKKQNSQEVLIIGK
jgi:adenine-specific DNA methylase